MTMRVRTIPGDSGATTNTIQLREYALSLPEAVESPHFQYTSFRVRGKIFATFAPGAEHVHLFVPDRRRVELESV